MKTLSAYRWQVCILMIALILAACGSSQESPEPLPDPTDQESSTTNEGSPTPGTTNALPPEATLQVGGQSQVSGLGSYCWPGAAGEPSICADTIGIPTAQDPLRGTASMTALFELPLEEAPTETQLTVISVTGEDELDESTGGLRWWQAKPGDSYQLPPISMPQINLTLTDGLYVFSVFARWEGTGDVMYGFLVDVGASQSVGFLALPTEVESVVILQDEVPFYNGPEDIYEIVRTSYGGLTWPVTGTSADGLWWQLNCNDKNGEELPECWVSANPSVTANAAQSPVEINVRRSDLVEFVVVLATAGLNMRAGPGVTYEVVTILTFEQRVQVTGVNEEGSWWRVRCPDDSVGNCWISADPALSEPSN
jgi:hypothetical protein